jgi:predicted transcriptional regulator
LDSIICWIVRDNYVYGLRIDSPLAQLSYRRQASRKDTPLADENPATEELLGLTADIVSAHVGNNTVSVADVPSLISSVYGALAGLGGSSEAEKPAPTPAVPVRSSIKPDYLVSLESGKKMKMLKRYLMTNYSMTPDDYRKKWGLAKDYPMVAPNYAEQRRTLAKSIGLGRRGGRTAAAPAAAAPAAKRASAKTTAKPSAAKKSPGRPKAAAKPDAKTQG